MKNPVRRENLFLIELVGCLLLFALCAAVCTGLLFRAHGMSRESTELTDAVYIAQSAAEVFRAAGNMDDLAQGLGTEWTGPPLEARFRADGTPDPEGDYLLTVDTALDTAAGLRRAEFTVSLDGAAVYKLEGVAAP